MFTWLANDGELRSLSRHSGRALLALGLLMLVVFAIAGAAVPVPLAALEAMRDHPRCHVPGTELARRIRQLSE